MRGAAASAWCTAATTISSRPTSRTWANVIDMEAIRRGRPAHRRRPPGRRGHGLLGAHRRALRARHQVVNPASTRLHVHEPRQGRQDPHGLLLALRHGQASSPSRTASTSPSATTRRRPPRHRHARHGAHEPQPLPVRGHRLPASRTGPAGRPTRRSARPWSPAPWSTAWRALGRAVREVPVGFKWFVDGLLDGSLLLRRRGERRRVLPAPRRRRLDHGQGRHSSSICWPPRSRP
jgi:hypothetical protein